MNFLTTRRVALIACFATFAAQAQAQAQTQTTTTPLRVILPVSAGAAVDGIVRAAQNELGKALGRPVVVENLPGAGGITGTQALVKAAPDGNTIAVLSNNHAVNPSVFKKLPYDSVADITPISVVGATPFVLVVNPARIAAKDAKELQALLKAKPGAYNYASSGNGTIIHLAGEMAIDALGADVRHIPYKGTGPQVSDLLGGQVEMGVVAVPAVQAHIKSGALRAIGVLSKQRVASLPEVPTFAEQGFPDVDIAGWFLVAAPKGLPAAQVARFHDAFVTAFSTPEVKAAMVKQDTVISPTTPEGALAFLKSEEARYARLAKKADIKVE